MYEVTEQSQTMINLFLQKDIHAAVRTLKLVKVTFTTDIESYFVVILFSAWKNHPLRNFKSLAPLFSFLKAN